MENTATGLTAPEKSPDQIERDMADTRDSISVKVAALETQVKGNIEAVTGTVEAVKDAISAAPGAVSDTVKQTMAAVKDSVRETIDRMDLTGCVRRNPWASVGTSTIAGFLTGLVLFGGRSRSANVNGGAAFVPQAAAAQTREPGMLDGLFGDLFSTVGKEMRDIAEKAFSTAVTALKQNVSTVVPQMVDQAVHRVTEPMTDALKGSTNTPRIMDGSGV